MGPFANPEDRQGNLNSPYTTSGGIYGRRVNYLPPGWGRGGLRRADGSTKLGPGTWIVGGRFLPDLEKNLSYSSLDPQCWGVPPPGVRSFPYTDMEHPTREFPKTKVLYGAPGGPLMDIKVDLQEAPSPLHLPPLLGCTRPRHSPSPLQMAGLPTEEDSEVSAAVARMTQLAADLELDEQRQTQDNEPQTSTRPVVALILDSTNEQIKVDINFEPETPPPRLTSSVSYEIPAAVRSESPKTFPTRKDSSRSRTKLPLLHVRGSVSERHNEDWTHKMRPGVRYGSCRKYRNQAYNPKDIRAIKSNIRPQWRTIQSGRSQGVDTSWKDY